MPISTFVSSSKLTGPRAVRTDLGPDAVQRLARVQTVEPIGRLAMQYLRWPGARLHSAQVQLERFAHHCTASTLPLLRDAIRCSDQFIGKTGSDSHVASILATSMCHKPSNGSHEVGSGSASPAASVTGQGRPRG